MASARKKSEHKDGITQWFENTGLRDLGYESQLREQGIENFELIKEMDDEDISEIADDVMQRKTHRNLFKNAMLSTKQSLSSPTIKKRVSRLHLNGIIDMKCDEINVNINHNDKRKTIMFIGQTGVGKTSLINSMVN